MLKKEYVLEKKYLLLNLLNTIGANLSVFLQNDNIKKKMFSFKKEFIGELDSTNDLLELK